MRPGIQKTVVMQVKKDIENVKEKITMEEMRNMISELREEGVTRLTNPSSQLKTPTKNTIIISAFPGCGKSEATRMHKTSEEIWLDSDSSKFHWIYAADGYKWNNPNFPQNYLKHIQNFSGYADVIFVSTHKEILELLCEHGVPFVLVRPHRDLKDVYLQRYKERGNDDSFINLMDSKWDQFMDDTSKFTKSAIRFFELGKYLFLSDIMDKISYEWRNTIELTTQPIWTRVDITHRRFKEGECI